MSNTFIVKNIEELSKVVDKFSADLKFDKPNLILLKGDLGSGKTTFTSILAKKLMIQEPIQSPSYNIAYEYDMNDSKLIHIDLWRLDEKDIASLRISDYLTDSKILVIEWAEKLDDQYSKSLDCYIWEVIIHEKSQKERQIIINKSK
jgi:tRNA threonylcarbamoyladenosine biosynthesis protein TsaE